MKALLLIALLASATVAQAYPRPTIDDVPPQSLTSEKSREEILKERQQEWDGSVYALWANDKAMANGRKNVSHAYTCGYQALPGMPTLATITPVYGQSDIDTLCEEIELFVNSPKGLAARSAQYRAAKAAALAAGFDSTKNQVNFTDADIYDSVRSIGSEDTKRAVALKAISKGEYRNFPIDNSNLESVSVHQTLGSVKCVRNKNWGTKPAAVWVDGGCAAIFKLVYTNN